MSVVPCERNPELERKIRDFSETLKTEAHRLGDHGLSEMDFYQGGLFRGAIERVRGQFSATMREKREFVRLVLNLMEDRKYISGWDSQGERNRHDYSVTLNSGRIAVIELKGCLDGNNTTLFERPTNANEFLVWSVCSNTGADPRHNVWSGIHTRLSAEIIHNQKLVDGLIVWDWICGTLGRPCPKLIGNPDRRTTVGPYQLTPPCIYLFPSTLPSARSNPTPPVHTINEVEFLNAMHRCFDGREDEINYVQFSVDMQGVETVRKTTITRAGDVQRESQFTTIQRG